MHEILLLGAGKIGRAIAKLLADTGDYDVLAGDWSEGALERLAKLPHVTATRVDAGDAGELCRSMRGRSAVLSACPFAVNPGIAEAALEAGIGYFDLTEDVATARRVEEIARKARPGQVFMPQGGLAPGFISILGQAVAKGFDRLDEVRLRVGALTLFPLNSLKYNLTWSTDGLINEYCNPCEAIHEGRHVEVLPLEGLEHFSLDGIDYEAFNTSGGAGTLWETLAGKVRRLDYKTVRYRGHRDLMAFLIHDLRLGSRRALLKDILEHALPITLQDVVLIFAAVTGWKEDDFIQVADARKIYHAEMFGEPWSAIQITTAAAACAMVDLYYAGALPKQGLVRQEQIELEAFLENRFGRHYASATPVAPASILQSG
jgi:saccharopine dehydrogenase-like NADP-dependent oxidoreductase